ncbi:MAG: sugar kinase [Granulosicoccus sp.]|nr:sugar kinase [Granulosicoccus sp.]
MKRMRIAAIGEIMVELSIGGDQDVAAQLGYAGDTANTAIYLKRLAGDALDVAYISVLGTDQLSDRIVSFLDAESLDTQWISRHPSRPPGLYAITVDEAGERSFIYWRENAAARTLFQKSSDIEENAGTDGSRFACLYDFDVVYFSGITLAILPVAVRQDFLDVLSDFRQKGGQVAFDSNYRPKLWSSREDAINAIGRAWSLCDIALPSVDDEQALFGDRTGVDVLDRLQKYGITEGALKCGEHGPIPLDSGINLDPLPAARTVVDTTAAGDSFNGAYLAARFCGASEAQAITRGHHCASAVVGKRGAIVSLDTAT